MDSTRILPESQANVKPPTGNSTKSSRETLFPFGEIFDKVHLRKPWESGFSGSESDHKVNGEKVQEFESQSVAPAQELKPSVQTMEKSGKNLTEASDISEGNQSKKTEQLDVSEKNKVPPRRIQMTENLILHGLNLWGKVKWAIRRGKKRQE